MTLSERKAAFITAMHAAGGPRQALPGQWIDLAQKHPEFTAAMRALFKRVPTPQRLGQWLQGHLGLAVGGVTLYGQHSARLRAWRYAVRTAAETEDLECQAAERQAEEDARREARRAAQRKLAEGIEDREFDRAERARVRSAIKAGQYVRVQVQEFPAPIAEPSSDFVVKVDRDGRVIREPVRDRDGAPIATKSPDSPAATPPQTSAPVRVQVTEATAHDTRLPPWVREGRQPTRKELAAWHNRLQSGNAGAWTDGTVGFGSVNGFADPGGVVSANMDAGKPRVHVCRSLTGVW